MGDLYDLNKGNPVSTRYDREFLLCKSGNPDIVDAFHRFVYGLENPSPVPNLWLRDDTADPGADQWGGTFWDSPDLWIEIMTTAEQFTNRQNSDRTIGSMPALGTNQAEGTRHILQSHFIQKVLRGRSLNTRTIFSRVLQPKPISSWMLAIRG